MKFIKNNFLNRDWHSIWPVVLPLVFFLIIELAGLFYEFGLATVGDEMTLTNATLRMIGDMGWRPAYDSFYHLPLGVYLYLPFFVLSLLGMRFGGGFSDWSAIKEFVILGTPNFLPLARFINIICAGLTAYLVFEIGRRLFGRRAGIFSLWFVVTSLLFVQMAQFAKVWMLQTLMVMVALFFLVRLYQAEKPGYNHHLLVGLGLILAFATHAIGALVGVPYLFVHYYKSGGFGRSFFGDKKFWATCLLFLCSLPIIFYLNPHGFTKYGTSFYPAFVALLPPDIRSDYVSEDLLSYSNIETSAGYKFTYYGKTLATYEPVLLVLTVLGLAILWRRERKKSVLFISFISAYYLAISLFGDFPFYFLPVIPWLALVGGYTIDRFYRKLSGYKRFLLVVFFLPGFCLVLIWFSVIGRPSTRELARDWAFTNLRPEQNIITNDVFIDLPENRLAVDNIIKHGGFETIKRKYLLSLPEDQYPTPSFNIVPLPHYVDRSGLASQGFDIAIITAFSIPELVQAKSDMLKLIPNRKLMLVEFFRPDRKNSGVSGNIANDLVSPFATLPRLQSSGPFIAIYQIKTEERK